MRISPLRTLSCAAATAFALSLAVPAFAAEPQGSLEPAPQAGADKAAPAPKDEAGTQAVTYQGAIFPLGDTVLLVGGGGTIFTFGLYNFTPGFNPAMIIRGAGRSFFVNRSGPNGSEFYRVVPARHPDGAPSSTPSRTTTPRAPRRSSGRCGARIS